MEQIIQIFVGCLVIAIGFLAKKYPNVIAGYNTMSKKEKESFDIEGYSSVVKKVSIISGCMIIIGTMACHLLGWGYTAGLVIAIISLSMCGTLVAQGQKFRKKS
jgi:hypothetical protein